MGAYQYIALDKSGRKQKGIVEGDTAKQVRQSLREKGLHPLDVDEVHQKKTTHRQPISRRSIPQGDLTLLTRQLASLISASLPVEEALLVCAQQAERNRTKGLLMGIRARVLEGHSLASGLREFPNVFSDLYLATVDAGEQAGHLPEVLERLADYQETRQDTQQKVTNAMIYPALLTVTAVAVALLLVTYVVPQVTEVYVSNQHKLPTVTAVLINISEFIKSWWWALLVGLTMTFIGIMKLLQNPAIRFKAHLAQLRLPLIGKVVRSLQAARFARTFSIVTASSVPVVQGLKIAASVVTNLPMQKGILEATEKVREGSAISTALGKSNLLPPVTIHMIGSGEASGRLEDMLARAAENQERSVEQVLGTVMAVLGPALIALMGLLVLFVVVAILIPVFEINEILGI